MSILIPFMRIRMYAHGLRVCGIDGFVRGKGAKLMPLNFTIIYRIPARGEWYEVIDANSRSYANIINTILSWWLESLKITAVQPPFG